MFYFPVLYNPIFGFHAMMGAFSTADVVTQAEHNRLLLPLLAISYACMFASWTRSFFSEDSVGFLTLYIQRSAKGVQIFHFKLRFCLLYISKMVAL